MRRKLGNRARSRHQEHPVISADLCAACEAGPRAPRGPAPSIRWRLRTYQSLPRNSQNLCGLYWPLCSPSLCSRFVGNGQLYKLRHFAKRVAPVLPAGHPAGGSRARAGSRCRSPGRSGTALRFAEPGALAETKIGCAWLDPSL